MELKLGDLFETGRQYNLNFEISEKIVKAFSELTGDRNSLHVDADFGRRSIYRRNVAHGLLTVAHVLLLDFFRTDNIRFSILKISSSFLKAVFLNESLFLSAQIKKHSDEDRQLELEYVVRKIKSQNIVAKGYLVLSYCCDAKRKQLEACGSPRPPQVKMVTTDLQESHLEFGHIEKNQEKSFSFKISRDCADALADILLPQAKKDLFSDIDAGFLAMLLVSTFAGMCLPGRYATIINFELNFQKEIQWDELYDFAGRVTFKSSVNSLSQEITISQARDKGETIHVQGKMNVQVNSPPVRMPSIRDLEQEGLDLQLKNKVVLITGASRGIGETTAKLFALYGAKVVVNYFRGKNEAQQIIGEIIGSTKTEAMAVGADVSDSDQVATMVKTICAKFGTVDILVNNAVGSAFESSFMDLSWDEIQRDIDIIVRGAFNCCKAVIPHMIKKGTGCIVNVSTVYTDNPPRNQFKYVVAKSGLVGLTRSLAVDLATHNIKVNMVVPSIVETDLTAGINKVVFNGIVQNMPMKRIASSVDVARAIIFLASSLNSFTTGQKIMVTGGTAPFF